MALEIEKKFIVRNPEKTLQMLKDRFGDHELQTKAGFWWCSNYTGITQFITVTEPKIGRDIVTSVKDIAEFMINPEEFDYLRLRVVNNEKYIVTFKTKSLIKGTEQNVEYEYETEKERFMEILRYLEGAGFIFYSNIKKTLLFKEKDFSIEYSTFNDLKDPYIEVELVGKTENVLHLRLNKFLNVFKEYQIRPETRSYAEISSKENLPRLKQMKLSQYSAEAINDLKNILNNK